MSKITYRRLSKIETYAQYAYQIINVHEFSRFKLYDLDIVQITFIEIQYDLSRMTYNYLLKKNLVIMWTLWYTSNSRKEIFKALYSVVTSHLQQI